MDCETCNHESVCMYDGTRTSVNYCSFYEMQRPHGEWNKKQYDHPCFRGKWSFECSNCGERQEAIEVYSDGYLEDVYGYPYCKRCGSDNRKKEGEAE